MTLCLCVLHTACLILKNQFPKTKTFDSIDPLKIEIALLDLGDVL